MSDNSRAYNSVWQLRGDAWCRREEAADRLTRPTTTGALKERYASICKDLLTQLTPLEPYWAYPGSPQFSRVQRLFNAGSYDKFAHAVTRINRALTTESYRSGDVDHAGLDDHDMFPADPRTLEHQPVTQRDQPYFEVLVVESMTEIEVEDIAGRLGQQFRRVFHAREGMLELHLSILQGVAARYRTPFFSALKQLPAEPGEPAQV